MKSIFVFAFLFGSFVSFGQSKKVINQQLRTELAGRINTYDSIMNAHNTMVGEIKVLRSDVSATRSKVIKLESEDNSKRSAITFNRQLLIQLGGNADAIITEQELKDLKSPTVDVKFLSKPGMLEPKTVQLTQITAMQDLTDMKIKLQNELLLQKIGEYKRINNANREILESEKATIAMMEEARRQYKSAYETYPAFNKQLEEKGDSLATKWYALKQIRDEENRKAAEKEILEARKKGKTVPPRIFYDVVRENGQEPIISSALRMKRNSGYDIDYGMDPEPFPEPVVMEVQEPEIYDFVEENAQFPGGMLAMTKYLKANINVPKEVAELGIKGKVYVRFVVSSTGEISNVKVVRGVTDCKACDNEAIRVVKAMPNWIPGKIDGKAVSMWYNIPVQF